MNKYKRPVGWRNESHRHYLAAKGISTSIKKQNRSLLKKWKMTKTSEVYVDKLTGRVVAAYDKKKGSGDAVPDDVLKKSDIILVKDSSSKYFAAKQGLKEGVYETQWGNAAVVRNVDGKLMAYDLDMGQPIPISAVTKKFIRELDEGDPEIDDEDDGIDSRYGEFFAKKQDELDKMFLGKMSYSEAKKKWEKKNPGKDFDVDAIGVDVE